MQEKILEIVKKHPGITPTEIAKVLNEPFISLVYQKVEALRKKKLVRRQIGREPHKNRRVWQIYPTA